MSVKLVQERLKSYDPKNQLEEENALKEITQEIALSGLSRAGFFKVGAFHGGTCLRIFYGLSRFSEDLDFSLRKHNPYFDWQPYLKSLHGELEAYGYQLVIQDQSDASNLVRVGFLKDDSIGKVLVLKHRNRGTPRSIKIKLEIDVHPPDGVIVEQRYLDFPVTVPVLTHDLSTLFAGKIHALLCRPWEKGRDWFDFLWYVGKKISPNFTYLTHAVNQLGPWQAQGVQVNQDWLKQGLTAKIRATDWEKQKKDIARFLKQKDLDLLNHWGVDFFLGRLRFL
jgi:hypothetical protein